ncbi:hypothetical protein CP533_6138 [Ophiocordyceps camponoti-saundersi (nom. inval.)]|nr:hypothetical protein CP533_6138 [Ophiocordyceps camponoti-saundersi (nom. inval.)]
MSILNQNFKLAQISFTLKDIDWSINPSWSALDPRVDELRPMSRELRKGDGKTLNVYFWPGTPRDKKTAGVAAPTFELNANDLERDGVFVKTHRLRAGDTTLTHEVGHWFGLYHTWYFDACIEDVDCVEDTPTEFMRPSSPELTGCEPRDTCKSIPGMDPVNNYMGHAKDECITEFTQGQIQRMHEQWRTFRDTESSPCNPKKDKPPSAAGGKIACRKR